MARLGKTPVFAIFTVERLIGPLAVGAMDALFMDKEVTVNMLPMALV